jgi:phosphoribosyl-AMP cyclohydrolase / phosphoribosyl-ATP pyrophosphohydrolase
MTAARVREEEVAWGAGGLVPGVVQDAADGRVLMVAYVDAEALAATLATGEVHFHSRSRDRLWRKGETSGNVLRLVDVALDCDGDALLLTVEPASPTCHRGTRSCFDPAQAAPVPRVDATAAAPVGVGGAGARGSSVLGVPQPLPAQGFGWLESLWATIDSRAAADPAASYTARLLAQGVDGPSRKVAEEAVEVLMAAKDDAVAAPSDRVATRDALTGEVADLLYHTLVVLRERGLPPSAVIARLQERHRR